MTDLPGSEFINSMFASMQARLKQRKENEAEYHHEYETTRPPRDRSGRIHSSTPTKPHPKVKTRRPFIGCDGEGSGVDQQGRQNYLTFRIGGKELCTGQHLTTVECLEHILAAPKNAILCGFFFDYDATMILRDLPPERWRRLLSPKNWDPNKPTSPYTYFLDYGIDYFPRKHLTVCRLEREGKSYHPIPGSSRTINEVGGFFQKTFVQVLKDFQVDPTLLAEISAMKDKRGGEFNALDARERDYNRQECELLAGIMEKLRDTCENCGVVPKQWRGAGYLASALLEKYDVMKRTEAEPLIPKEVWDCADAAYYGGRFEITRTGPVDGPIYEYDINSAYPSAMPFLPCLRHGKWEKIKDKRELTKLMAGDDLFVAGIRFNHEFARSDGMPHLMMGLPIRNFEGRLIFPARANGMYWSVELRAAEKLGMKIEKFHNGFRFIKGCDCDQPDCNSFEWVRGVYTLRKSLGKSTEGYPLKIGTNSLYGKTAQRVGKGPYKNFIWAGLITAITRAKLIDAIAQARNEIVMVATDGVYSKVPLSLPVGDNLGDWEHDPVKSIFPEGLFLLMPGLYWDNRLTPNAKMKTRGVSQRFLQPNRQAFLDEWLKFKEWFTSANRQGFVVYPEVSIKVTQFIGMKLAYARNKPELAGTWLETDRRLSFDWTGKRVSGGQRWENNALVTYPMQGFADWHTVIHGDPKLQSWVEVFDLGKLDMADCPDYVNPTEIFTGEADL